MSGGKPSSSGHPPSHPHTSIGAAAAAVVGPHDRDQPSHGHLPLSPPVPSGHNSPSPPNTPPDHKHSHPHPHPHPHAAHPHPHHTSHAHGHSPVPPIGRSQSAVTVSAHAQHAHAHEHEAVHHQVLATLTQVLHEQKANTLNGPALSQRLAAAIDLLKGAPAIGASAATEEAVIKRNIREKRSSLKTAEEKEVVAFISREYLHRKRGSASAKLQKAAGKDHRPASASEYFFTKAAEAVQFIQRIRGVSGDVATKVATANSSSSSKHHHAAAKPGSSAGGAELSAQEQIESLLQREVVQASFEDLSRWSFDPFQYHVFTQHRALAVLLTHLMTRFDFWSRFNIPRAQFARFATLIEDGYHAVPYHNHLHACDVTQNTLWFLQQPSVCERITPLDLFAALIAAAIHDFQHPGTTNAFQIATESDLAYRYNDKSVLESMHCSSAFMIMRAAESNILAGLSREQKSSFRETVVAMVLATDMAQHFKNLAELRATLKRKAAEGSAGFELKNASDRLMILETALHCSDLGNPTKPQAISLKWTERVLEEFYTQGDKEKALGLPISPMMDRTKPSVELSQLKFIEFVVQPLYETVVQFVPEAQECVDNMTANYRYWEAQLKAKPPQSPTPAAATAASTTGTAATTTGAATPAAAVGAKTGTGAAAAANAVSGTAAPASAANGHGATAAAPPTPAKH